MTEYKTNQEKTILNRVKQKVLRGTKKSYFFFSVWHLFLLKTKYMICEIFMTRGLYKSRINCS